MFNWKTISLFVAVLALAGCVQTNKSEADTQQAQATINQATINGEVWYRERIALPDHAKLIVTLEDTARQDVAADVIATNGSPLESIAELQNVRFVMKESKTYKQDL